ncbi:MAG TPA: hypothetical protein DCO79_11780 [Spirochaeta sp.]|nr:hypothetical protein [Spirochaeta sp.]
MLKDKESHKIQQGHRIHSLRWQLAVRFALATIAVMFVILTGLSVFIFSKILIANWQISPENWIAVAERTALPADGDQGRRTDNRMI